MYDDNENFKLDSGIDEENESLSENFVDLIENGYDKTTVEEEHVDVTTELDVNRRNREGYEQLMRESTTKLDGYWDVNNQFVKVLLIGLLIFIVVGSIIVLGTGIGS